MSMDKVFVLFTDDMGKAVKEVELLGGRAFQQFTDRVFEAAFPDIKLVNSLKASSTKRPVDLDEASKLVASAHGVNRTKAARAAATPEKPRAWNSRGFQAPRHPGNDPELKQ